MAQLKVQQLGEKLVFHVKVLPGSSKTTICGFLNGTLKLKISAAAEKGKANRFLIDFLAKRLGVKKNAIRIISGHTSTVKKIQVTGLTADNLLKIAKAE